MRCCLLLLAMLTAAGLVSAQDGWEVGAEREVEMGSFVKLLADEDGWRTYLTETSDGKRCATVKPQDGVPPPRIIGSGSPYTRSTETFVEIFESWPRSKWRIDCPGSGRRCAEVGYRLVGGRLMTRPSYEDPVDLSVADQVIEFFAAGYEYYEIQSGYGRVEGTIDMTGLLAAVARHDACVAAHE